MFKILWIALLLGACLTTHSVLAASGDLDRSFGYNGLAFFDSPFYANAAAVQSNDRILLGGSCYQSGVGDHFLPNALNFER